MIQINYRTFDSPYPDGMMKTNRTALTVSLVIGALITVLIGCGPTGAATPTPAGDSRQPAADPAPTVASEPQLEADNGVVIIGMYAQAGKNYNSPIGLHVEPGTTVRFENRSGAHTATAYHPDNGRDLRIPPGAEPWDSGLMARRGQSFEVTLTVPGVYDYYCLPHEAMGHVGRIIVGDPQAALARSAEGLPRAAREALPSVEQIMASHVVWPQ